MIKKLFALGISSMLTVGCASAVKHQPSLEQRLFSPEKEVVRQVDKSAVENESKEEFSMEEWSQNFKNSQKENREKRVEEFVDGIKNGRFRVDAVFENYNRGDPNEEKVFLQEFFQNNQIPTTIKNEGLRFIEKHPNEYRHMVNEFGSILNEFSTQNSSLTKRIDNVLEEMNKFEDDSSIFWDLNDISTDYQFLSYSNPEALKAKKLTQDELYRVREGLKSKSKYINSLSLNLLQYSPQKSVDLENIIDFYWSSTDNWLLNNSIRTIGELGIKNDETVRVLKDGLEREESVFFSLRSCDNLRYQDLREDIADLIGKYGNDIDSTIVNTLSSFKDSLSYKLLLSNYDKFNEDTSIDLYLDFYNSDKKFLVDNIDELSKNLGLTQDEKQLYVLNLIKQVSPQIDDIEFGVIRERVVDNLETKLKYDSNIEIPIELFKTFKEGDTKHEKNVQGSINSLCNIVNLPDLSSIRVEMKGVSAMVASRYLTPDKLEKKLNKINAFLNKEDYDKKRSVNISYEYFENYLSFMILSKRKVDEVMSNISIEKVPENVTFEKDIQEDDLEKAIKVYQNSKEILSDFLVKNNIESSREKVLSRIDNIPLDLVDPIKWEYEHGYKNVGGETVMNLMGSDVYFSWFPKNDTLRGFITNIHEMIHGLYSSQILNKHKLRDFPDEILTEHMTRCVYLDFLGVDWRSYKYDDKKSYWPGVVVPGGYPKYVNTGNINYMINEAGQSKLFEAFSKDAPYYMMSVINRAFPNSNMLGNKFVYTSQTKQSLTSFFNNLDNAILNK